MKKLRLKALSLGAKEILSREQLKTISGGTGSGSGGTTYPYTCVCIDKNNPNLPYNEFGCNDPSDTACMTMLATYCNYSYSYAQPQCQAYAYNCSPYAATCLN